MRQTINFILAVLGFILLCLFIAFFVMKPLIKKYPIVDTILKIGIAIGFVQMLVSMARR
jgi:hypothetical protein